MTRSTWLDVVCGGLALLTLVGLALAASGGPTSGASFRLYTNTLQVPLLAVACVAGLSSARLLGKDSPARPAWLLLATGLCVFLVAETVDAWYEVIERTSRPFPSVADVLFVCGYLFVVPSFLAFIRVYRASGYEVGSSAEHALIAAVGVGTSIALGFKPLQAILDGTAALGERVLGVTYPLLDFATLVLALVLLRIAVAFRGGQIWRVWALLLMGFAFTCAADMLFAFLSFGAQPAERPLMEALYVLSYLALARGTLYEFEMLSA